MYAWRTAAGALEQLAATYKLALVLVIIPTLVQGAGCGAAPVRLSEGKHPGTAC